jgi:prevent-host-death family protein
MRNTYSLYEAKAKLSAIVRRVREGDTVVVTFHGEPVAEIRPIEKRGEGLTARLDDFADRGVLVRPLQLPQQTATVARKPGALKRFLAERD